MNHAVRVLIVEDSGDDGRSVERALEREGFALRSCRVEKPEDLRQAPDSQGWVRVESVVRRELDGLAARRRKRAAEAKYAAVFRSSPNPMALSTLEDGRFLEANEALSRVTGYTREEIVGRTAVELGFWSGEEAREGFARKLRETGTIRGMELSVPRKDGRLVDLRVASERLDLPEGQAALTIVEDVTEKNRARRALELSEERFSKAFFSNPNPAVITTLEDGEILEVNETLCELSGYRRDELIGHNGIDFGLWDQEHAERARRLLEERGSARDLELRARNRDGMEYELLVSAVVVEMAGEPCVLSVVVDMTERNKLQAQLLRAQRLETLGTLAGGLAHDLNNVLTPILMAIKLLRRDRPGQSERLLNILESNANRGSDLIRQLLSFTRGTGGDRVPVQLEGLVHEIEQIVRDTFPKAVDLEVELDADLWTVEGEPTQLQQVLLNLAINARDAMEGEGTLSLGVHNRELAEGDRNVLRGMRPGRYVELEVSDTGPGIPEKFRPQIFDPFFTTKEPGCGTGLGLFTVERIVRAHGGSLEVTSGSGRQGTRFRIYLPVGDTREGRETPCLLPALPQGDGELVLIIDDEEAIREIAAGILKVAGYRALLAADGCAGLARFEEHQADVRAVVVDLRMPGTDGAQTIRALRELSPDVPIVAMSGVDGDGRDAECPPEADLFLSKPLTAEDLLDGLQRVLRDRNVLHECGREAVS